MALSFSDEEIRAKAEQLGLTAPGAPVPRHLRGRAAAALAAEAARPVRADAVPVAESIVVQPGGSIEVDGGPFPWVVQADQIEVTLRPDGAGLVRLTIPANNVQITRPVPADESE